MASFDSPQVCALASPAAASHKSCERRRGNFHEHGHDCFERFIGEALQRLSTTDAEAVVAYLVPKGSATLSTWFQP